MTLNGAIQGNSLKIQLMQKGSLLLLAAMASLFLAFQRHNGIMMGAVLAIATVVVPVGYVLMRRVTEKLLQHETEDRLMMHTRAYLRNEEPACAARVTRAAEESDIEILARTIDGQKLAIEDFRKFQASASPLPVGDPAVFDALPRRYATRSFCDRRFADLAALLPKPASLPLRDLLPAPATRASGS
jgi:hypothetical protein